MGSPAFSKMEPRRSKGGRWEREKRAGLLRNAKEGLRHIVKNWEGFMT